MTKKRKNSFEKLDLTETIERRKTGLLTDGSFLFEDRLESKGVLTAVVVTCTAWLLEIYKLEAGEIFFMSDAREIRPKTRHFGIFYPPFTITRPCFKDVKGHILGIAATEDLTQSLTAPPFVFDMTFDKYPSCASEAIEILNSGENLESIETNPRATLLSLRAKKLIDENYLVYPSIARVAARLRVSHAHLSRQFKNDFKMTPSDYLRQLRLADAPLKFARGEKIINVSMDSGYNDLSRFYKQFRQTTGTSPGACQTIMKTTAVN